MSTQLVKLKRVAIFLAAISTASIPSMTYADWSIMALDSISGGGFYNGSTDINDSGQVVGWSEVAGGMLIIHAFITGPNGIGTTDLGTLGGARAKPQASTIPGK